MSTSTRTVTVNAAFLQEIKEDNCELRSLLERCLTVTSPGHTPPVDARAWSDLMARLRDQLAMHFALEEAYGYFEDALDDAPRLGPKADELRQQHCSLYVAACQLAERAERLVHGRGLSRRRQLLAGAFRAFHEQLQAHEARENELILEAFDDDIGVGD